MDCPPPSSGHPRVPTDTTTWQLTGQSRHVTRKYPLYLWMPTGCSLGKRRPCTILPSKTPSGIACHLVTSRIGTPTFPLLHIHDISWIDVRITILLIDRQQPVTCKSPSAQAKHKAGLVGARLYSTALSRSRSQQSNSSLLRSQRLLRGLLVQVYTCILQRGSTCTIYRNRYPGLDLWPTWLFCNHLIVKPAQTYHFSAFQG